MDEEPPEQITAALGVMFTDIPGTIVTKTVSALIPGQPEIGLPLTLYATVVGEVAVGVIAVDAQPEVQLR